MASSTGYGTCLGTVPVTCSRCRNLLAKMSADRSRRGSGATVGSSHQSFLASFSVHRSRKDPDAAICSSCPRYLASSSCGKLDTLRNVTKCLQFWLPVDSVRRYSAAEFRSRSSSRIYDEQTHEKFSGRSVISDQITPQVSQLFQSTPYVIVPAGGTHPG